LLLTIALLDQPGTTFAANANGDYLSPALRQEVEALRLAVQTPMRG